MVIKPMKLVLLLCIFSTICNVQIELKKRGESSFTISGSKEYEVSLNDKNYNCIHIRLVSEESKIMPHVIVSKSLGKDDDRIFASSQQYGPINFYFNANEYKNNIFYVSMDCQSDCDYTIIFKDEETCELNLNEQSSYFVTSINSNLEFYIKKGDDIETSENSFINIWAKGMNISKFELEGNDLENAKFDFGQILYGEYKDNNYYHVSLQAGENDYVTIGNKIYSNKNTKLKINDLEMMGILDNKNTRICFPIDCEFKEKEFLANINGIIYTKKAKTALDKNGKGQYKTITNGVIFDSFRAKNTDEINYCIENLEYDKKVIFSLQITSYSNNENQNLHTPLLSGVIYRHSLLENEIAIFRGMKPRDDSIEINFNMNSLIGFPDMKFTRCQNYPNCYIDPIDWHNIENPHHTNKMTAQSIYLKDLQVDFSPISVEQPIIVVNCTKGDSINSDGKSYCEFETVIFTDKDRLNLVERETFSQFLLKDEIDLYTINLENKDNNLVKVYIDLTVLTGDVDLNVETKLDIANKYFLSNEIFYSIHVESETQRIDFNVKALKDSYYIIQYQLVYGDDDSSIQNQIRSGINYIIPIYIGDDADYKKVVYLENLKTETPYLVNFYSPNCHFEVKKDNGEYIETIDNYGQIIIDKKDSYDDELDKYSFDIEVTYDDVSSYLKKFCMVSVSGLDISNGENDITGNENTISVSDGIPQNFIFSNQYPFIAYTYILADLRNPVVINFNLLDKAPYDIIIYIGKIKLGNLSRKIYRNDQIIIETDILEQNCILDNETCTINVFIKKQYQEQDNDRKRLLETTIYQINGSPVYLEKNAVKKDVLIGSEKKHYYFDIGEGEYGDITVDYKRGSGKIFAQVVRKSQIDKNPTWRGKYSFPETIEDSLKYETYLKKIMINLDDTYECENGCYVLITVINTVFKDKEGDDKNDLIPYRISITPRIFPKESQGNPKIMPKVRMYVNDFVIGNVQSSSEVYEYYQVYLPYESEYVIIDWQADYPKLLINVGNDRPFIDEAHFNYSLGHDSVITISKDEILSKIEDEKPESIRGLYLTLGIYTSRTDSLYTSPYAFKIFMPPTYKTDYNIPNIAIELIHIRSDQKVQCQPVINEEYEYQNKTVFSCLFAVIFDGSDEGSSLALYPRSPDEKAKINYSYKFVEAEPIERNNIKFIVDNFPDWEEQFHSQDGSYIFEKNINLSECLLFEVDIDKNSTIEVLSSTYLYSKNQTFYPNPSTPQIYAIGDNYINFNFATTQDYLINIVSLSGEGALYWEKDINERRQQIMYFLKGYEDRLTLTSAIKDEQRKLSNLVIYSTTYTEFEQRAAGFAFYITFYPRNGEQNIDQVKVGRSIEMNYREVKFPLSFYTAVPENSVDISFTFYNYFMETKYNLTYNYGMFKIWGTILSENDILNARYDNYYIPPYDENSIDGVFDGAFGRLYFDKEYYDNFSDIVNPQLFFMVSSEDENIKNNFNGISVELSIFENNKTDIDNQVFAPENVYLNGKITKDTNEGPFIYKLKIEKPNKYMLVEFSTNIKYVKWAVSKNKKNINDKPDSTKNEEVNGRHIIIYDLSDFKSDTLYLTVYCDSPSQLDSKLGHYIFKYETDVSEESFFLFELEDDDIQYEITKNDDNSKNYILSFSPLEFYDVNYYVKAVYKDKKIYGEIKDSIAISEREGFYLEKNNPEFDGESKIYFTIPNIEKNVSYIKILAKANFDSMKEFVLYQTLDIESDEDIPDSEYEYEDVDGNKDEFTQHCYNFHKRGNTITVKNARSIQMFELIFNETDMELPNYIKVQVNDSNHDHNHIIYFSNTDKSGKENRIQLGQSGTDDSVFIWIKREQFENANLYIAVESQSVKDKKGEYELQFIGYQFPQFDNSVFVHNYYVSKNNTRMTFRVINSLDIGDINEQILSLYATGGKRINLTLRYPGDDISYQQSSFTNGVAITAKILKQFYFQLIVEAEEGDYISVGSKIIEPNGQSYGKALKPNEYQLSGYLKKNILEKECYFLDINDDNKYYITGIFYKKYAQISLQEEINSQNYYYETIDKGYFSYIYQRDENNYKYICIRFPKDSNYNGLDVPYSLQLTCPSLSTGIKNYYSSQLSGTIYPRITSKGSVAFFNSAFLDSNSKEIIYNMKTIDGLPKMYIYYCQNYPNCELDSNTIENNTDIIKIQEVNRISTWRTNKEKIKYSPIDSEQYVIVVLCQGSNNENATDCQFQTSIYGNNDNVSLIEGQSFSQFLREKDKDRYIIEIENEKIIQKIHIDTLVISGDVSFDLRTDDNNEVDSHKYYLANKIFYSITYYEDLNSKKIIVDIQAKKNSYYVIEYKLVRNSNSELTNDIYDNINYLVPILSQKSGKKMINVRKSKILYDDLYYTTFYSLNCEIEIDRILKDNERAQITVFGNFGQDVIMEPDELNKNVHSYEVTIKEKDLSSNSNNMCMLYVNGLEMVKENNLFAQKEILVGEGVPQKTLFNFGVEKIRYVYPHTILDKNIALNLNVINKGEYIVTIYFNNNYAQTKTYYSSYIEYIDNSLAQDKCKDSVLCTIIVEIEAKETDSNESPMIEITLRYIENTPYYISKNLVNKDFVSANSTTYLFTNVGENDEGYVTVDFLRGSGSIYSKIVPMDGEGDKNPEWRQYELPKSQESSLKYDFYNKKILFDSSHTQSCKNGCYLLITIISSIETKFDNQYRIYDFSISIGLVSYGPIIELYPEQYIVGSLQNLEKIRNNNMYEFYTVTIPYNASKIEIDWQSDAAILLLNVGEKKRPFLGQAHFTYNKSRSDTIFELTPEEIFDAVDGPGMTIANIPLVFGVYTENIESIYGTNYIFRVHFSKDINIHPINSDQKTLCRPEVIPGDNIHYRCLFMIMYNEIDFINDVMIYSRSQNSSATTYMYSYYVNKDIYDKGDYDKLKIPDGKNSIFNTEKENIDFIYTRINDPDSHMYVSVVSDTPDIIEFITSFKTFDLELSPNPSTTQLFTISNNQETLSLKFITRKGLFINIVSLYGSSEITVNGKKDEVYDIRGRDDRLSLAIPTSDDTTTLIIRDKNYKPNIEYFKNDDKIEKPGVAFYLEYYLRSIDLDFDEISLGKTTEVAYSSADFPLYYYSKIDDYYFDVNIFFNFHDLNRKDNLNPEINTDILNIRGSIISQKTVYIVKRSEESSPTIEKYVPGIYDPALKAGYIYFPSSYLEELEKKVKEPVLYLSFEKNNEFKLNYTKMRVELTATQENSNSYVTEKLYQYGKLNDKNKINSYKLKVDNSTGFMRIQFSTNSKYIDFSINEKRDNKNNMALSNAEKKVERGKVFITFEKPKNVDYIYLNVFFKDNDVSENQINNYAFKYINSDKKEKFFEYKIIDNNPQIDAYKNGDRINVKFNKIENDNVQITYSLKGIKERDYNTDELLDTIAITESKATVSQVTNPQASDNKITLELKYSKEFKYVQVIAQIIDGPINEYVAYKSLSINDITKDDSNSKAGLYVVIAISACLFVVVIILVIVIFIYNNKNKDLMDQVNKISFVQSGAKSKDDVNLLLDNQNELS